MTESEAKANIKTYVMVEAENLPKGMEKALNKAIKALERQIPKNLN